jgi:hypothetical protein
MQSALVYVVSSGMEDGNQAWRRAGRNAISADAVMFAPSQSSSHQLVVLRILRKLSSTRRL